jgi:hypothetical protein
VPSGQVTDITSALNILAGLSSSVRPGFISLSFSIIRFMRIRGGGATKYLMDYGARLRRGSAAKPKFEQIICPGHPGDPYASS